MKKKENAAEAFYEYKQNAGGLIPVNKPPFVITETPELAMAINDSDSVLETKLCLLAFGNLKWTVNEKGKKVYSFTIKDLAEISHTSYAVVYEAFKEKDLARVLFNKDLVIDLGSTDEHGTSNVHLYHYFNECVYENGRVEFVLNDEVLSITSSASELAKFLSDEIQELKTNNAIKLFQLIIFADHYVEYQKRINPDYDFGIHTEPGEKLYSIPFLYYFFRVTGYRDNVPGFMRKVINPAVTENNNKKNLNIACRQICADPSSPKKITHVALRYDESRFLTTGAENPADLPELLNEKSAVLFTENGEAGECEGQLGMNLGGEASGSAGRRQARARREQCLNALRRQLDFEAFGLEDRDIADKLIRIMADVMLSEEETVKIRGSEIDSEEVRERFRELGHEDLAEVVRIARTSDKTLRKPYLVSCLYSSYETIQGKGEHRAEAQPEKKELDDFTKKALERRLNRSRT